MFPTMRCFSHRGTCSKRDEISRVRRNGCSRQLSSAAAKDSHRHSSRIKRLMKNSDDRSRFSCTPTNVGRAKQRSVFKRQHI